MLVENSSLRIDRSQTQAALKPNPMNEFSQRIVMQVKDRDIPM
tara:strand:- start:2322 stop:2450 length:129 start_codon:yes stop_codon:yes gene_type:complete